MFVWLPTDIVSVPDLIRAEIASSIPPWKTIWGTVYLQFVPGMCGDRKLTYNNEIFEWLQHMRSLNYQIMAGYYHKYGRSASLCCNQMSGRRFTQSHADHVIAHRNNFNKTVGRSLAMIQNKLVDDCTLSLRLGTITGGAVCLSQQV